MNNGQRMKHKAKIAVCGATATGKSRLAVLIAQRLSGEVVSFDSMQVYRGMDVGTAKATEAEMCGVPHRMIDIAEPGQQYSVADYAAGAAEVMAEIEARGLTPVLCGGTGLYLDAVLYENRYSPDADSEREEAVKASLEAFLAEKGPLALHERLRAADPEAAEATHPNNVRRVMRALTVYETTGKTKTEWDKESRGAVRSDMTVIGLRFADRELHRKCIGERCRKMVAAGLVEETERLWRLGALLPGNTAAQAIGYKEMLPYIRGEETLDAAVDRLYYATCRYAKRQATWFGAKDYVRWLTVDDLYLGRETEEELLSRALDIILKDAENVTETEE